MERDTATHEVQREKKLARSVHISYALDFTGDTALNEKDANNFLGRHRRDMAGTAAPRCNSCAECPEWCEELREENT